jgi:nucleoid DNA-binding protein
MTTDKSKRNEMNHTHRIAHVARQRRYMRKAIVKEAVELYLEVLANEIASGEWVDIKGIGKIQVIQEDTDGILTSFGKSGKRVKSKITQRLRTKVRLYKKFKIACRGD